MPVGLLNTIESPAPLLTQEPASSVVRLRKGVVELIGILWRTIGEWGIAHWCIRWRTKAVLNKSYVRR